MNESGTKSCLMACVLPMLICGSNDCAMLVAVTCFLDPFAKLRRAIVSSVVSARLSVCLSIRLSVCLSAWNNSVPIGLIFMKFDT